MEFLVDFVKAHPETSFEELKAVAAEGGYNVFPATYGSARRRAGLPALAPAVAGGHRAALAFVAEFLRVHPEAAYEEVRTASARAGHQVLPITYGNARRMARLPKLPPTPRRPRVASAPTPTRQPRKRALPPAGSRRAMSSVLDDLVTMVQRLRDRHRDLQEALAKIGEIARECLKQTE
jgi:hypothetical protein